MQKKSIVVGQGVYNQNGRLLGHVTGLTEKGFEAELREAEEDEAEDIPGKEFGEGYLMWRCIECGEMGELEDGFPESCPSCGASKESIMGQVED
jgi:rubrerythrin